MKGVILAGGQGKRLFPLTKVTNKHLLPVGRVPMIFHSVKQLVDSGIKEIMVVTSTEHMGDLVRCLGSGEDFGCTFSYRVQEKPLGIAHALSLAGSFARGEKVVVILADNIFGSSIRQVIEHFSSQKEGARVVLKKVSDPTRYGVAALDEKQVITIEEKPKQPPSDYAVVGLYCYDGKVFDILETLQFSDRGELEITSLNKEYIKLHQMEYEIYEGKWMDAGTPESWFEANRMFFDNDGDMDQQSLVK
jgi:glucose-1-phosphate thymidylyltransferase